MAPVRPQPIWQRPRRHSRFEPDDLAAPTTGSHQTLAMAAMVAIPVSLALHGRQPRVELVRAKANQLQTLARRHALAKARQPRGRPPLPQAGAAFGPHCLALVNHSDFWEQLPEPVHDLLCRIKTCPMASFSDGWTESLLTKAPNRRRRIDAPDARQ